MYAKAILTIIEILRLGVVGSSNHGNLDLLKALALDSSSLFQSLLRICKFLALGHC